MPVEVFADASPKRKQELIRKDARYANVVCRCEHVTEAEIVQSIHRPCGATTVDGVKFRAGAGMGRCHGGFCLPRVMAILSRELKKPYGEITKSGQGRIYTDGQDKGGDKMRSDVAVIGCGPGRAGGRDFSKGERRGACGGDRPGGRRGAAYCTNASITGSGCIYSVKS